MVVLSAFFTNSVNASHAAGGELVYQWLGGNSYRFIFKFYRDCGGSPEPSNVTLCITNQCANQSTNRTMVKMSSPLPTGDTNGTPVTTGCANQKSTCDSAGSNIPGYKEWWYFHDFTLPAACSSWRFSVNVAVRNASDNIQGLPNFYVETFL